MTNKITVCPRCGSTAQVKFIRGYNFPSVEDYVAEYECGCGCKFEEVYEMKEVNIID